MAICNIFNKLTKESGNFMMFSQYIEDITRNYTEGENWRVIPSRFIALDINYNKFRAEDDINIELPKYIMDKFENACAYGRKNYYKYAETLNIGESYTSWNPEISKNLFWNSLFEKNFLTLQPYGKDYTIEEIKYWGDITMQSYDEHHGMGYGEIYCYIPTDGLRMNCTCRIFDNDGDGARFDDSNKNIYLEGYNTEEFAIKYSPNKYFYDLKYKMSFDTDDLPYYTSSDESYNINTIIVLYDVLKQVNNKWQKIYSYIPLGMYVSGIFDTDKQLTNTIKKFVTTSYGTGTSYGLRICTRFTVSPKGMILKETELTTDSDNYTAISQLMTNMSECLSKMLDISKNTNTLTQYYKDTLATIKNNRTNVPYVTNINGTDWWFVNGRAVSSVSTNNDGCCSSIPIDIVEKRIKNVMDNNTNNDFIPTPDCDCSAINYNDLRIEFGLEPDPNGPNTNPGECGCDIEVVGYNEVFDVLTGNN